VCIAVGLFLPAVRTIYLSFRGGEQGAGGFTLDHYESVLGDDAVLNVEGASDILTSRLFFAGLVLVAVALLARRRRPAGPAAGSAGPVGPPWRSPWITIAMVLGVLALLFAVFGSLRAVIWNNLWWLVTVTVLATSLGLVLAALADRSRGRSAARTLLLVPLVISMVAATVIWTYVYNVPGPSHSPGSLNAVLGWFGAGPVDFLHGPDVIPWNNLFQMVVMIWIETGFAMVVLTAAVTSVPTDVVEAARVDGAKDAQIFRRITLPQIVPALVIVIATLMVTATRVFDIVKVGTNGQDGTDVLANRMYENLRTGALTTSSTFAVLLLVLALPVVWFAARRAKASAR